MSYPITFGKYLLLERINVGGMAEVFKAKAFGVEGFERILAIKRILPNMAEDDEFINMFIDEARIAVQLTHANIVPIYELGKFENQYYIAMEYVPGRDLRQILDRFRKKKETMPLPAACYVTAKICEGLDYAHRKNDAAGRPLHVIHRDVSPQNILVGYEGEVKITDFGIVKAEDRASKTQAGVLKGKFGYMSPEQVRGLEIDHRSDIFAVGILLYEALTGKRLFIGESDFSTLEKVRNAEVSPPSEHNPAISPELDQVVLKALARERDERYQWAMELHDDLQRFLIEEGTIFSGKKLSNLLKEEYAEEIAAEQAKMDEFMRMPPPSSQEALSAAAQMRAAPTGDWSDNRAEKTMIFESGFDAVSHAQTQIGAGELEGLAPTMQADELVPPRPQRRQFGVLALAGVIFVVLLAALVFLLVDSANSTGSLVVTSVPTDVVDVFMDGELIGKKTPVVRRNVPVGEHTLLARAPGYAEANYRFDLVAGAPAEIKIELTHKAGATPTVVGEATVEITSDPSGAQVRLGGVPQGLTPYSLKVPDVTHATSLEVLKTGFVVQSLTVPPFAPGQKTQTVHVKLVPPGPPAGKAAKLTVKSVPEGATVYLDGAQQKKLTPIEIGSLDPHKSYRLELTKEGFLGYERTIELRGRAAAGLLVNLVPERRPKPLVVSNRPAPAGCSKEVMGGKLSIMPVGVPDCKVVVNRVNLGIAPMFMKNSPVGRCPIEVSCPGGKHFQVTKMLRAGTEEKIVIHPEDWQ